VNLRKDHYLNLMSLLPALCCRGYLKVSFSIGVSVRMVYHIFLRDQDLGSTLPTCSVTKKCNAKVALSRRTGLKGQLHTHCLWCLSLATERSDLQCVLCVLQRLESTNFPTMNAKSAYIASMPLGLLWVQRSPWRCRRR
jgi:hypothetical protein